MVALSIQCPSCGLRLHHGERLLLRVRGRRGTTRCPRCRDRVHFDATGGSLSISFPDLYAADSHALSANISRETTRPAEVEESPTRLEGDRASDVVVRRESSASEELPREALAPALVPIDLSPGDVLFGSPLFGSDLFGGDPLDEDLMRGQDWEARSDSGALVDPDEPVFPLVLPRRLRQG